MTNLKFVTHLSENIEKAMRADLAAYERDHGIEVNYKPFSLVLEDRNEALIGVLKGYTAFAEIYVEDLWVARDHRRKGYGKRLLQGLEDHFKGQGFNNINLITSQFQAPEFYKKCGFELEFIRKNLKHPQLTKFFFVKYFEEEIQTQGLLREKGDQMQEGEL